MAETPYTVNYEDERFKQVETDKTNKLNETNNMYNEMIGQSDSYYQAQIDASKEWATTQQDLQNQQTDLAIEQINQQKDQANKDYTREQKGAYSDYQKQINSYGANIINSTIYQENTDKEAKTIQISSSEVNLKNNIIIQIGNTTTILSTNKPIANNTMLNNTIILNATQIIGIIMAIYLSLNTVMNFSSKSKKEKYIMTPISLTTAVCFWITAL